MEPSAERFILGPWTVEPARRSISRDGVTKILKPRPMKVLLQLADAGGNLVATEDFFDSLWKGKSPSRDVLTVAVSQLRTALEDDAHSPRFIETVHQQGYRLLLPVQPLPVTRPARKSRKAAATLLAIGSCLLLAVYFFTIQKPDARAGERATIVAVQPFANLTGIASRIGLALGLECAVIAQLSNLQRVVVVSFPADRARETGADVILEGELAQTGAVAEVTARLTEAATGRLLWSHVYQLEPQRFPDVLAAITSAVHRETESLRLNENREPI